MDLEFNEHCIKAHNELRALHRASALKISKQLAAISQEWANNLANKDKLEHSDPKKQYGENIAKLSTSKDADEITLLWYREIFDYKFGQDRQETSKIGHFSQVVWQGSTEAGFGIAKSSKTNTWYVVGRYKPPGNIIGQFHANVSPPASGWQNNQLIKKLKTIYPNDCEKSILFANVEDDRKFGTIMTPRPFTNNSKFDENDSNLNKLKTGMFQKSNDNENSSYSDDEDDEDDEEMKEKKRDILDIHNEFRSNHGIGDLKMNMALNRLAQKWSNYLAENSQLSYSNQRYLDAEVGENIALKMDCNRNFEKLLDNWYCEEADYNYGEEPDNISKTGHFTQMVWVKSEEMGAGFTETSSGQIIFVCFYYPAGNVMGEFRQNVKPTK